MAYEPKTWECGEVVTADALNHLEQGVASAGVEVECQKLTHDFEGGDVIGIKVGRVVMLKFVRVQNTNAYNALFSKRVTLPSEWMPVADSTSAEGVSNHGTLCVTQVNSTDVTTRGVLTPYFAFIIPFGSTSIGLSGFNSISADPQYKYFIDGMLTYVCAE